MEHNPILKALAINVKEIAANAADYLQDRYLMDPVRESWHHAAIIVLKAGKHMLDYNDQDWKKTHAKNGQDVSKARVSLMNTIVQAAAQVLMDMQAYQKKSQEANLKELSDRNPEYQQKTRSVLNGEVELPARYKTHLGNVMAEQQARIQVYQEGIRAVSASA